MFLSQNFVANKPKLISRLFCVLITISSEEALANSIATRAGTVDPRITEESIASAQLEDLTLLEHKIARIMQENPQDIYGNYLMSTLLLRMFTLDPGNYTLIRQSTELAAQTYDLNKKSDLAVAALANILEVTGENDRGLALLNDSRKHGIKLGWRSNLAKARLTFDGKNAEVVLTILDEVLKDPDASPKLASDLIIDAIAARYDGAEQINKLREYQKRCPTLAIDLALANALSINGEYQSALSLYEKISMTHPDNAEALLSQGIIAIRAMRHYPLGIKKLKQAISISKDPLEKSAALTHLALALIIQNKSPNEITSASVQAVAQSSDKETTLVAILAAYRRHGSVKTLLAFLEALELSSPGLHLAYALKAETLSEKLGKYQEATRAFTNAITLEPSRSEYYNGRGLAWMGIGNLDFALEDFENASAVNPADASARYNIACVQARLGMKEEALTSLAQALTLDGQLATTARSDQDLRSLRGDSRFQGLIEGIKSQVSAAH
jgi:tetratricopeptide (TPR) repeat protein